MKIGFITCPTLEKFFPSAKNSLLTHDDQVLADYLARFGHQIEPVLWGTSPKQLESIGYDILLMRSAWNYSHTHELRQRFFHWLSEIPKYDLIMINDPSLMLWNLDKHYLDDIKQCDVLIVPTEFIEPEDPFDLNNFVEANGPVVVKPAIGAGAQDAYCIRNASEASALSFDKLRRERSFLVQPFLTSISVEGEWSLVFIDGIYSHAVWKRPAPGEWRVQDELGGSVVSADPPNHARILAERAIACLPNAYSQQGHRAPLYGRVDVITDDELAFVSEIELVEPELFFQKRDGICGQPNIQALENFRLALERIR